MVLVMERKRGTVPVGISASFVHVPPSTFGLDNKEYVFSLSAQKLTTAFPPVESIRSMRG
jgi:hypothetical protein